ncbi:hypothetical protein PUN28_006468 [Cardiocondyla obscurior]|uniref:Uncharacterized protein n=1 Tax=Cardiocondyla obscurior TaxID=286306 RepID=A0AAW2G8S3_9HYME
MPVDRVHSIWPVNRVCGEVDRPSRRQSGQHVSKTRDGIINAKTARRRHEPRQNKRGDAVYNRRMRAGARGGPLDRVAACKSRATEGDGGDGGEDGGGGGGGREDKGSPSRADRGQPD